MANDHGVFIIYTGGTIGSLPKDREDPSSPLEPAPLEEIIRVLPNYNSRDRKIFLSKEWVRIGTYSWPKPLDSSNISLNDWIEMARVIKANYEEYEGFVILHGTDTLAYTASALSFMLENLNKPVIITGSQLPVARTRSDAIQNIVTAIEIAAAKTLGGTVVPEVTVFFRDNLFRGCRTAKLSASSFGGFSSPNYPPVAEVGEYIKVTNATVARDSNHVLRIVDTLEPKIASMDIFPGMSTDLLRNILCNTGLRGVVLQTFGTGNAPSTPEFLEVISDAVKNGTLIVDITQCRSGEVELGLYDVSAGLLSRGVVSGMDMTPEAALTKMFVVLGSESNPEIAADKVQLNLKGEQRQSIFNLHFPAGQLDEDSDSVTVNAVRPMVHGLDRYQVKSLQQGILRIMGLEPLDGRRGRLEFKVYIDLPDAKESTPIDVPHFLGRSSKKYSPETGPESAFLTVTEQVRAFIDNSHENTLTIVNTGGAPFKWSKLQIACFADC
jgi:L-asparaginase